ncbi:hypothetical protein BH11PSE2_BH11PSE2_07260 [soil metagenome]
MTASLHKTALLAAATSLIGAASMAASSGVVGGAVLLRGDLHVHDDHSSDGSAPRQRAKDRAKGNVSVGDQIAQAVRMGLQFLPLTDHRTYDQQYDPLWESSSLLLIPGEEANGSPHAIVLGGVDSVVQGAARADRAAFTIVQQSIWDAHSQGATWTVAHPDDGETDKAGAPNAMASVQGMDLVEIWNHASDVEKEIDYCENRWNAGFRFGVAGASDSHFREYWDRQGPGLPTTNVLAALRNERGVLEGLRAGHTSLSINPTGPFVTVRADLAGRASVVGGDEVVVRPGVAGLLHIRVQRAAGLQVLVYRKPGRSAGVLKTFTPTRDDEAFTLAIVSGDQPDWYRVEVRGLRAPAAPGAPVMELKAIASPLFIAPAPVSARPEIQVPEDSGRADGAVLAAGARGQFVGFADIATEADVIHLVSEAHGVASSAVVYRRRNPGGGWNGPGRTLSGGGLARFPKVTTRGRDVWVAWQEDAVHIPHRPSIRVRHSADGGATWQPTIILRAVAGRAEHPDIAVGPRGRPVVVWQEIRAGQAFDVMSQDLGSDQAPRNLSGAGKVTTTGEADDTRSARYPASVWPSVAVDRDGRIAVAWQDDRTDIDPLWTGQTAAAGTNPDDWQIQVVVRGVAGVWAAPISLGGADMADRHPDLAFGGGGELVAAWESKALSPAGKNLAVLAAVSRDGGRTFSPAVALAPDVQAMSQRPRLGAGTDGAVQAIWYDSRSVDWRWRVMTAALSKSGWSAGTLLEGRGVNTWPAISGGVVAFASTRNATRLQRDATQQVFLLPLKTARP